MTPKSLFEDAPAKGARGKGPALLSEMSAGQEADLFVLMTLKEELTTPRRQALLQSRLSRFRPRGQFSDLE